MGREAGCPVCLKMKTFLRDILWREVGKAVNELPQKPISSLNSRLTASGYVSPLMCNRTLLKSKSPRLFFSIR